jgi:hypothetical protein
MIVHELQEMSRMSMFMPGEANRLNEYLWALDRLFAVFLGLVFSLEESSKRMITSREEA